MLLVMIRHENRHWPWPHLPDLRPSYRIPAYAPARILPPGKLGAPPRDEAKETLGSSTYLRAGSNQTSVQENVILGMILTYLACGQEDFG